jgi:hypothetical protein
MNHSTIEQTKAQSAQNGNGLSHFVTLAGATHWAAKPIPTVNALASVQPLIVAGSSLRTSLSVAYLRFGQSGSDSAIDLDIRGSSLISYSFHWLLFYPCQ